MLDEGIVVAAAAHCHGQSGEAVGVAMFSGLASGSGRKEGSRFPAAGIGAERRDLTAIPKDRKGGHLPASGGGRAVFKHSFERPYGRCILLVPRYYRWVAVLQCAVDRRSAWTGRPACSGVGSRHRARPGESPVLTDREFGSILVLAGYISG